MPVVALLHTVHLLHSSTVVRHTDNVERLMQQERHCIVLPLHALQLLLAVQCVDVVDDGADDRGEVAEVVLIAVAAPDWPAAVGEDEVVPRMVVPLLTQCKVVTDWRVLLALLYVLQLGMPPVLELLGVGAVVDVVGR